MAAHGGPVPWWRVVRADGSLPPSHEDEARPYYLEEGTPLRPSGNVDIRQAFWRPPAPAVSAASRVSAFGKISSGRRHQPGAHLADAGDRGRPCRC